MKDYSERNGENSYGYGNRLEEEEGGFDIRILWVLLLRYKYWFIASVVICLSAAFAYLRYTVPVYNVTSKVLIKDRDNKRTVSSISATFQELGMKNNSDGFANEIEILATKSLAKRTVRSLKLYTSYQLAGRVKDAEVYRKHSPYLVDMDANEIDSLKGAVSIVIDSKNAGRSFQGWYAPWGTPGHRSGSPWFRSIPPLRPGPSPEDASVAVWRKSYHWYR